MVYCYMGLEVQGGMCKGCCVGLGQEGACLCEGGGNYLKRGEGKQKFKKVGKAGSIGGCLKKGEAWTSLQTKGHGLVNKPGKTGCLWTGIASKTMNIVFFLMSLYAV